MRPVAGLLLLSFAAIVVLTPLPAQDDAKKDAKDAAKAEAKADAKGDAKAEKKDDETKKDDAKPDEKKPAKTSSSSKKSKKVGDPVEERIFKESYVQRARIFQTAAESNVGLTVELPFNYQPKVTAAQVWFKQQLQLGNRSYEVLNQYKQKLSEARRIEVKPGDEVKVRVMNPPVEYDDKGNLKRWTPRDLAALRGASRLPGFPAAFDSVRPGQIVDLYLAKVPAPKRTPREKKKVEEDEDPTEDYVRPEVLMIVVVFDPPMRQ